MADRLITGKQIKNNTITTADIKNKTLKAADLSPAAAKALAGKAGPAWQPGQPGDAGPAGPVGPVGPAGPKGATGVSEVGTHLEGISPTATTGFRTVFCGEGEHVLSGGVSASTASGGAVAAPSFSIPVTAGGSTSEGPLGRGGWRAGIQNLGETGTVSGWVYVVCAKDAAEE
jgi:hypothetical protein